VGPALDAKRLRGNTENSLAKDRQRLDRVLPMLSGIPARKITAGIIERTLEALARGDGHHGPLKGSTVNRYHSAISSVLRYAARQRFIATNPLAGAAVPWSKEQKVHVRYLAGEEEARLLKVIRADCPDKEAEVALALLTGMRRSEQFSVRWEDWSPEAGILHVKGKTGAREVQVSMAARAALESLRARAPASQGFITPEANAATTDRRTWFEHAAKRAGLRPVFHWRDLRHTFASRLAMAGISLLTIQELCGHATFTTTLRYAHLSPAHRKEAVEKVGMSASEAGTALSVGDSKSPLNTTFASKTNESEQS
jgi:site-specific recombinase XerD